ncbi:MAG TPA: M28 family peptidase [Kofleriaceae bacterium]|nr:M28 family peptidase [Kofleriaceae bacterium]
MRSGVGAAHHDHLGRIGRDIYRGADDNAAAVAILVEVARRLAADPPAGRRVLIASFDGEEPPHFLTPAMGSEHYARHPQVALDRTDLFVCMDLVGHAVGPADAPAPVSETVFALGGERSGAGAVVDRLARAEPGVVVRPLDAESVPPLSDYAAFWRRQIPFLFLSNGRSRVYHTPDDTPDRLDRRKMAATVRWLERFTREACAADALVFRDRRDDASTLRSIIALLDELTSVSRDAAAGLALARDLHRACSADGRLPDTQRPGLQALLLGLESGLA